MRSRSRASSQRTLIAFGEGDKLSHDRHKHFTQRCFANYVIGPYLSPPRASPQGNNCSAIAIPPAGTMAHFKMMAKRRFGSSQSTPVNRNAPRKMISEI